MRTARAFRTGCGSNLGARAEDHPNKRKIGALSGTPNAESRKSAVPAGTPGLFIARLPTVETVG
jgi:hypothetical protein